MCVYLVVVDLSGCSESLLISISLIASFTSSFSTTSTIRRRACNPHTYTLSLSNMHATSITQPINAEMLHSELCRHCQTETSAMP